jgi:hypothetical protein
MLEWGTEPRTNCCSSRVDHRSGRQADHSASSRPDDRADRGTHGCARQTDRSSGGHRSANHRARHNWQCGKRRDVRFELFGCGAAQSHAGCARRVHQKRRIFR